MRHRIVLASAILIAAMLPAAAQNSDSQSNRIIVSGEAAVSVEPDLVQIRAGVTTDAKSAQEAADANAKAMTEVSNAVRALGVPDTDVQTARYSLQPVYEAGPQNRNRLVGFQASNSLLITIRERDRIGELIDQVVGVGANTMGNIEFMVSEPSKHLDDARKRAVEDARRRAELYASAAGVKLGRPIEIIEQSATVPPQPMMMMRSAAQQQTPISPGERTLRLSISVAYELLN